MFKLFHNYCEKYLIEKCFLNCLSEHMTGQWQTKHLYNFSLAIQGQLFYCYGVLEIKRKGHDDIQAVWHVRILKVAIHYNSM